MNAINKRILFFSEENIRGNHAGTKARNDAECIFRNFGCQPLNKKPYILKSDENDNIYSNMKHRIDFLPLRLELTKIRNKIVIVQYPMLSFDHDDEFLAKISAHNHLIFLVHDVHGLKRQNKKEIEDEIKKLNMADAVILHNRFMRDKLIECGLNVRKIYLLNIFDYLYNGNLNENRFSEGIIFAGNLEKSDFFQKMAEQNPNVQLQLFGPHYDSELSEYSNIHYYGSIKPDDLPQKLMGKYGLVWDGNSIETCSGIFGEYTKYNNPHKLSLYLAAGFPVIVWKKAAIAEYVEKFNVGIAVDSLINLKEKLASINAAMYKELCGNVLNVREGIISGENLTCMLKCIQSDFE